MNLVDRLLDGVTNRPSTARGNRERYILVVGDAITDLWLHGRMEQCQDGCPKFVQELVVETPGGAANAANCLREWGNCVHFYTYSRVDNPIKSRCVGKDGKVLFRIDNDKYTAFRQGCEWSRGLALEMVECVDGVLLSDYDKGFLTPGFIGEIVGRCRTRGIPCVADCKREPGLYAGCVLKGNMEYWLKHEAPPDTEVVMTRGSLPPMTFDGLSEEQQSPPVKCVNHVGAGDCFAAHLTLALACGFSLKDAAALAHGAGRVYVQHPHNHPPTPAEVAADLATVQTAPHITAE